MDYSKKYTIKKHGGLGSGGNGVVKTAIAVATGEEVALKCLSEEALGDKEKHERFEDEVNTMLQAGKMIKGIIPILDYSIEDGWYVMPVAERIKDHCKKVDDVVSGVLEIAETLAELHKVGLSHRDIKPDNILYYDGRWVLCDFGLVDIPDNPHNLTKNTKRIGAVRTIAPEMTRYPKDADGRLADVYSLAKSLWMLLTGKNDGFEGRYVVTDKSMSLHEYDQLKEVHLVEIDELLNKATQNFPDDRPTMEDFVKDLREWQQVKDDDWKKARSNWNFIKRFLFQGNTPQRSCWMNPRDILHVLNVLSMLPTDIHLFFPNHGWMEFTKAEPTRTEPSCLDIYTPLGIYRVKLGQLLFESFLQPSWDYFMLEAEQLEPAVGTEMDEWAEEVVEDGNGKLVSAVDAMYGVYDYDTGEKLPKGSKLITRCLKGKFLILLKQGPYNMIPQMDDGRHANCESGEFRKYIEQLEKLFILNKFVEKGTWRKMLGHVVDHCPFKPVREMVDTSNVIESDPDFVKNNMTGFDFSKVIANYAGMPTGKAKYRFIFHASTIVDFFNRMLTDKEFILCKDGHVREVEYKSADIFEATDREAALAIGKELSTAIEEFCNGKVWKMEQPYFSIEITKTGTPSHLFSKEEIKELMIAADDRHENTLVIDEDGNARIIADREDACVYPVVHPTWCARKVYVGKYSTLPDLDISYHNCLGKWYDYLTEGVGQTMDDYEEHQETDEELVKMIEGMRE